MAFVRQAGIVTVFSEKIRKIPAISFGGKTIG
jgi:hypothetical protein